MCIGMRSHVTQLLTYTTLHLHGTGREEAEPRFVSAAIVPVVFEKEAGPVAFSAGCLASPTSHTHVPRAPPPSRVLFCHCSFQNPSNPLCPCQVIGAMNSGRCTRVSSRLLWGRKGEGHERKKESFGSARFRGGDKHMSIILRAACSHGSVQLAA